jgi:hypothetical protein
VWNSSEFESVTDDEIGMGTVKSLGQRVAQVAMQFAGLPDSKVTGA